MEQPMEHSGNTTHDEIIDRLPKWAHLLALGLYITLVLLAFSANSIVLFTICRVKDMRRSAGGTMTMLLGNLALADLLLGISTTLEAVAVFEHSWIFGPVMCKVQRWFMYTFYSVSMLSLITISVERYYAICDPLNLRVFQNTSLSRVLKTILAIWIAAMLLESPQLYISDVDFMHRAKVCKDVWPDQHNQYIAVLAAYYVPMFILLYALPLFIFSLTVYKIGKKLRGVEERLRERSRYDVLILVKKRQRILRVLFVVVIVFLLCWTPFNFVQLINRETTLKEYDPLGNFYVTIKMIALCHAVLSPIIWTLMSQQFRNGIMIAFGCCRDGRKPAKLFYSPVDCNRNQQTAKSTPRTTAGEKNGRCFNRKEQVVVKHPSKLNLLLASLTPKNKQREEKRTREVRGVENDGVILEVISYNSEEYCDVLET